MPNVKYDVKLHLHFSEDVFTRQMKNDLAFRVRKKCVIVLTEHQSTLNENMPLRFLMYLGRTYNQMMTTNAVYKERRIELDAPEFVVFYNGDRNQKEYWEMHLSDAFPEGVKVNIDLRVRVYNINYGKNSKLLQQTKLLSGYSYFVDKIKHLCKNGSELKEAIDTAVRECIKEGVLTDQLTYLGSEVMGMFATEFDMDEAVKVWKEEAREEGLEEGREEGRAKGEAEGRAEGRAASKIIEQIMKKYKKGCSVAETADMLEENPSAIEQIYDILRQNAPDYDVQKIYQSLLEKNATLM